MTASTSESMRSAERSRLERTTASTEAASMTMAVSLLCRPGAGYAVPAGELLAGVDVIGHELRAGGGGQLVVGVLALHLVLDIVGGLRHLADVVEVAADADQQGIGPHQVGRPLRQVADDNAVVKRPRRLLLQPPQQGGGHLGQLEELRSGGDAEHQAEDDGG